MPTPQREYIDLIHDVSSKWVNWDPLAPVEVGSYGEVDSDTGELRVDGNIYDPDFQRELNKLDLTRPFSLADHPPQEGAVEDSLIIASKGVEHLNTHLGSEPGIVGIEGQWQFEQGKRGALLILYRPRERFIPRSIAFHALYRVPRLKDKWLVTSVHVCPAFAMCFSDKTGGKISLALVSQVPGFYDLSATAGTDGQVDFIRKAWDKAGNYCYTPLYTFKRHFNWASFFRGALKPDSDPKPRGDDLRANTLPPPDMLGKGDEDTLDQSEPRDAVDLFQQDPIIASSRMTGLQQRCDAQSIELIVLRDNIKLLEDKEVAARMESEKLRRDLASADSKITELREGYEAQSIESQERYEKQTATLIAVQKENERLRRESRDHLRILQFQTDETQKQYEERTKALQATVAERHPPLSAIQRFFAVADTYGNTIIVQTLQQLNTDVQLIANALAECVIEDFRPQDIPLTGEQTHAAQGVTDSIGLSLADRLRKQKRDGVALHLPIALQAHLVYDLCRIISSWSTEKWRDDIINEIYEQLQKSETQTTSGRWRSLTRTYIVPTYRSDASTAIPATVEGLSNIAVAAGCADTVAAATSIISSNFDDKLSFIFSVAGRLSKTIGENISADFNVFTAHPGEIFEGTLMEEDTRQGEQDGRATDGTVLCATSLGLTKRTQLEKRKWEMLTVIRAKVVF